MPDFNTNLSTLAHTYKHLQDHSVRILTEQRYTQHVLSYKTAKGSTGNLPDSQGPKPLSTIISSTTLIHIKQKLTCSSAMFLFNRYKVCVDLIISAWHLALQNKGSILNVLPKTINNQEYSFLLFASLFVMRGYAESLIISQFLDNVTELRKLQRYILQFINYFPKHLIEFLMSPSLIEEIMNKNMKIVKSDSADKTLVIFLNFQEFL